MTDPLDPRRVIDLAEHLAKLEGGTLDWRVVVTALCETFDARVQEAARHAVRSIACGDLRETRAAAGHQATRIFQLTAALNDAADHLSRYANYLPEPHRTEAVAFVVRLRDFASLKRAHDPSEQFRSSL